MFQVLFKYPAAIFSKGHFILLGTWPRWSLLLLVFAAVAGLGWFVRSRMGKAAPGVRNWRAGIIWLLRSAVAALILLLLWQPAITIAELKPQQNIIAVLVDDSRSMAIADNGATRQAQAVKALDGGVLADLQKRFQTRLYTLDSRVTRVSKSRRAQALRSRHAHRRQPQATRRGNERSPRRRNRPAHRRCGQFRRHRPRYDFGAAQPPHSGAHRRPGRRRGPARR